MSRSVSLPEGTTIPFRPSPCPPPPAPASAAPVVRCAPPLPPRPCRCHLRRRCRPRSRRPAVRRAVACVADNVELIRRFLFLVVFCRCSSCGPRAGGKPISAGLRAANGRKKAGLSECDVTEAPDPALEAPDLAQSDLRSEDSRSVTSQRP